MYSWDIDYNGNGTITAYLTGDSTRITRVLAYSADSCGKPSPRRDFRAFTLDNPCICGFENSDNMCVDIQGRWTAIELQPVSSNSTTTIYQVSFNDIPQQYWTGMLIGLQYQFFEHKFIENSFDKIVYPNGKKDDDDGFIGMFDRYGRAVFTTEVSIQPNVFPFLPCNGQACYGTLV